MFTVLVIAIHIIVCVTLVLIILLQTGKGADIGAVFGGGGSNTLFGSSGATTFLSKVTIAAAVTFMITSITLSYFAGKTVPVEKSIMDKKTEAGAKPGTPAGPEGAVKEGTAGAAPEAAKPANKTGAEKGSAPATQPTSQTPSAPAKTTGPPSGSETTK